MKRMNEVVPKETNREVATPAAAPATRVCVSPDVDIFETANGYVLEAEMPGVTKENLEITLEGNCLTFIGHRADEPLRGTLLLQESRPADFRRVFELDPAIDSSRIHAQMQQGVLTLELPKAEAVKPRKISVE